MTTRNQPLKPKEEETFGAYLRNARQGRGINGRVLAQSVGISPQYLSDIERGFRPPPSEAIIWLFATALAIDSWELIRKAGRLPEELVNALLKVSVEEWRELLASIESDEEGP